VKLGGGRGIGELAVSAKSLAGRLKLAALARLRPQFVCVSSDLAEECARYLGSVPVQMLPNGVDLQRYTPVAPEVKTDLRRELGWPEGLGFLYVGRLSWEKRLDWFLENWRSQVGDKKSFLVFVGEGPEKDKLEMLAAKSGAPVFVMPPRADIEKAYAAADVFVLPSVSEGLSNALLEAMACGLAVLASRVGGTPDVVTEGAEGLLFASGDETELESKLARLLQQPDLAVALGAAARQKVAAAFSIEKAAAQYQRLYES
jgi:glycosyltransferase involved in cell wall biosynthesis